MSDNHCEDCCCARSWKALGISEYTGRSIPEEIDRLRAELEECRFTNRELKKEMEQLTSPTQDNK